MFKQHTFLIVLITFSFTFSWQACFAQDSLEQNKDLEQKNELEQSKGPEQENSYKQAQSKPQDSAVSNGPDATENPTNNKQNEESEKAPEQETNSPKSSLNIPQPPTIESWHEKDLSYYENSQNLVPMLIGEESFISLHIKQTAEIAKGVAIIVPDWQQHLASPKSMMHFRNELPEKGWHILGMQPPLKPKDYPHLSPLPDELESDTKALEAYKLALKQRINLMLENASEYPGIILVVAEGVNAALLTEIFTDGESAKPSAFISLSAYIPSKEENNHFPNAIAKTSIPVLDLYLDKDNQWVKYSAPLRKRAVRKSLKPLYRQVELSSANSQYPTPELSRQILGWLSSLGW